MTDEFYRLTSTNLSSESPPTDPLLESLEPIPEYNHPSVHVVSKLDATVPVPRRPSIDGHEASNSSSLALPHFEKLVSIPTSAFL
jgi:hypothetical protein